MVVLVVGVVAVALNILLYFGIFVPRVTPLIANVNSLGTSLPEAILPEASGKSDSVASGKSDSDASNESDSVASGKSDSDASSKTVTEASGASDSEASSEPAREAGSGSDSGASGKSVP